MDKSRITAAIWPWGTTKREQMEQAAKEISEIGYECFESVKAAIYAYDLDLNAYKEVCDRNNIKPVSFYYHLPRFDSGIDIFATLDQELDFISRLGVKRVCLQATNGRPDEMTPENMQMELDLIARLAERTKDFDIKTNLHPHNNTWVMYENEIDYIMESVAPETLAFAPDTAHLVAGKCDPVAVIKKYLDRVNFTHFKDIQDSNVESAGWASAGMEVYTNFCELGKGCVDFRAVFDLLKSVNYDGPLCEELDSPPVSNAETARNNYHYLLNNY